MMPGKAWFAYKNNYAKKTLDNNRWIIFNGDKFRDNQT
jgi:hypothetical protein